MQSKCEGSSLRPLIGFSHVNSSAMAYDESVYRDPDMFSPERFLPDRGEPIPINITFGHGRRSACLARLW